MATDPALIRQIEETLAAVRRQHEAPAVVAAPPPQAIDPTLIQQMVANEVMRQTRALPAAPVVSAPAAAPPQAAPAIQANDLQKLAMVAVLGEENTAWLLGQSHLDLMAFAVSKEGREALALITDEARKFVKGLRPAA